MARHPTGGEERGSALEHSGALADAAEAYRNEGNFVEAARVMIVLGEVEQAGLLLARHVRKGRGSLAALPEEGRDQAFTAALCLSTSGHVMEAAEIFLDLKEPEHAVEVLEANDRKLDAERVRRQYNLARRGAQ